MGSKDAVATMTGRTPSDEQHLGTPAARAFVRQELGRSPHREDERLARAIVSAKDGSRDAVSYIYCRYADSVCRYVQTIVHDEHEAQDIMQSVFVKLLTNIKRYEFRDVPFAAWLFRVARNVALDHLRQRRAVPVDEVRHADASATGPSDEAKAASLRNALGELPDAQRVTIVLRHFTGLSPGEIARRIGTSEASVHGLHHRGRRALQRALIASGAAPTVQHAVRAYSAHT